MLVNPFSGTTTSLAPLPDAAATAMAINSSDLVRGVDSRTWPVGRKA